MSPMQHRHEISCIAPGAGPARRRRQVERDHRRARAAGPACAREQHRHPGRHGQGWPKVPSAAPDGMARRGCQTAIAEKILARGGDYLLTLKGNHPLAHAAVVEHFDQHCFRRDAPGRAGCDTFDDTHGRLVRRRVFASTEAAALDALSGWPGLRTVLAVESIRSVNSAPAKVESETRYVLSSCPDDPAILGQAIRSHWAVENVLHWVLDVTFREDDSRVRERTAVRNLALLRKIALNIVSRDRTSKASVRARRKKAAWNDAYMLQLLAG